MKLRPASPSQKVYLGPSDRALGYFEAIGFAMPPNVNPADFFMDIIANKARARARRWPRARNSPPSAPLPPPPPSLRETML